MSELTDAMAEIARAAAKKILDIYHTDFTVESKDDRSPVTQADLAAHEIINDGLARLTPSLPVLSEESAAIPYSTRKTWKQYWLVDPLDGTREFIKRNGEFTVNIALIKDHHPVAGVVYAPVKGLCYCAAQGEGARRQAPGEAPVKIKTKRTRPGAFVVSGSRSHGNKRQDAFFNKLEGDPRFVPMGSSLKICLVAEGVVDIYPRFGPTCEWDTAAAQCIVEEAGGRVTDFDFARLRCNAKDSLLNPNFIVIADPAFDWNSYF